MPKLRAVVIALVTVTAIAIFDAPVRAADIPPSDIVMQTTAADTAAPQNGQPIAAFPINIKETEENGYNVIIKTYALEPDDSPDRIPTEEFEKFGVTYTLSDITKKEIASDEQMEHIEKVEIDTASNELDAVVKQIAPTIPFEKDGFSGTLALDITTITCEVAGYKTSTYEVKKTREYPHLSDADLSLVPKSITESGTTYQLVDASFNATSSNNVDYENIPTSYTAVATYSTTASSKKVTGYITTAEYKGILTKAATGQVIYTAIYIGDAVTTPEPTQTAAPVVGETQSPSESGSEPPTTQKPQHSQPTDGTSLLPTVLTIMGLLLAAAGGAAGAFWFLSFNGTVYCQSGKEYRKLGKVKINIKEPVVVLDKLAAKADSECFVVELSPKAYRSLAGRDVCVRLGGETVIHTVDESTEYLRYQFEADFSTSP